MRVELGTVAFQTVAAVAHRLGIAEVVMGTVPVGTVVAQIVVFEDLHEN